MGATEKQILFLSMEEVVACGGSDIMSAAEVINRAFHLYYKGEVLQPHKTTLKVASRGSEQGTGLVNFLPAYVNLDGEEIYSCKGLGAMPSNVESGLPRATGLITLYDSVTKSPLCVMDAQVISATRTGAVSSLAAKKLARPDTERIALIGAGVNMRTQLLGLRAALPKLKEIRVYSRNQSKYQFASEMSERVNIKIQPVTSAQAAIEGAELIVTCLPNVSRPVVLADDVMQNGITIFNIGCYECEDVLLKKMDRIVADVWEQGKHRGVQSHAVAVKNGAISEDKIEDLAPILTNNTPGRTSDSENIFFCPTGLGFEDAVVAWQVYKKAQLHKIGTHLSLWKSSKWI